MDPVSLLWGNLFCLDLYRSLEQFKAIYKLEDASQKDEHLDIRLDAFRLKVRERVRLLSPVGSHCHIFPMAIIHGSVLFGGSKKTVLQPKWSFTCALRVGC